MADFRKPVIIRLNPDLVARIDTRAHDTGVSRNEWITRAVTFVLTKKGERITETKEFNL